MRILAVADEESKYIWDFFNPEVFKGVDIILSCGDLDAEYLSFLATMIPAPVFYIHGNHDKRYNKHPPEGCINIDGGVHVYKGIRILGLGGCKSMKKAPHEYTEEIMRKRVSGCSRVIKKSGGFDILMTHAPANGIGDMPGGIHEGFRIFNELVSRFEPKYHLYGHVHKCYGVKETELKFGSTSFINVCGYRLIEY